MAVMHTWVVLVQHHGHIGSFSVTSCAHGLFNVFKQSILDVIQPLGGLVRVAV